MDLVGVSLGPPRLVLLGGGPEELLCAEAQVCSGQPAACLDRCLLSWPRVPWDSLAARGLCPSLLVLGLVSQLGPSISGSDSVCFLGWGTGPGLGVRCLCARKPRALNWPGWGLGSLWLGPALGLNCEC